MKIKRYLGRKLIQDDILLRSSFLAKLKVSCSHFNISGASDAHACAKLERVFLSQAGGAEDTSICIHRPNTFLRRKNGRAVL
jgi:hypothetical protein